MPVETEAPTELRALALADDLRPQYHFTSPAGWLNDPNGVAQRDGLYHLFYQHNPFSPTHQRIHWGHAVSTDLVRWTDRPIALSPSAGPDDDGCWSGVLVDDDGRPVIVYSGNLDGEQTACLAYGDETLTTWTKEPGNPVLGRPEGVDLTEFRDHCVWREDGRWRQLIGSGIRGVGGTAYLYESDDLIDWRLVGPLVVGDADERADGDPLWTGTMWECVDFFRLESDGSTAAPDERSGDRHVLIFSAWDDERTMYPLAATGSFERGQFEIDGYQRLDLGGRHAYAPQTFIDERERRILWSWMQEARGDRAQLDAGWSGAMALPRVLKLDAAGIIRQEPVPELDSARGAVLVWNEVDGSAVSSGVQAELGFEATIPAGAATRIELFRTPDGAERTVVELRRQDDGALSVSLDRSLSSLDAHVDGSRHAGTVPGSGQDDTVSVRVFLDRSAVEVFVDGIALTTRVYPSRADADGIRVIGDDATRIDDLRGWRMLSQEQADRELDLVAQPAGGEKDEARGTDRG